MDSTGMGFRLPFVPKDVMDIIEDSHAKVGGWHDLGLYACPQTRFLDIQQKWCLGGAIYKDWLVIVKARRPTRSHSAAVRGADSSIKRLPNPHMYL